MTKDEILESMNQYADDDFLDFIHNHTYPSLIYEGNTWDKCKDCQFLTINGRCRYTRLVLALLLRTKNYTKNTGEKNNVCIHD